MILAVQIIVKRRIKWLLLLLSLVILVSPAAYSGPKKCIAFFTENSSDFLTEYKKLGSGLKSMKALGDLHMAFRDQIPDNWNGKTYVFSPGLSKTSLYFDPVVQPLLDQGIRVIRFDAFNTGGSLVVNGGPKDGLNLEADGIAQAKILARLNLTPGQVYLIGHSRGAATAMITANILGPQFIARVDAVNPYVRWLPNVFKEQASDSLQAWIRLINLFNPLAYHPVTKSLFDTTIKNWSELWANFGIEVALGFRDFESIVRKDIQTRSSNEATQIDFETEVAGVMAQYNAMKEASILPVAKSISQQGLRAGVWSAKQDRVLVPSKVVAELRTALNLGWFSNDYKLVDGTHHDPIEQTQNFLNWLLRP